MHRNRTAQRRTCDKNQLDMLTHLSHTSPYANLWDLASGFILSIFQTFPRWLPDFSLVGQHVVAHEFAILLNC